MTAQPGGPERRVDLALREFIGKVIRYLKEGGDHANALMNMTEHGVPNEVQRRVLSGRATQR